MKPLTVVGALGLWAATVLPVHAAWNNVFQPTLFGRWKKQQTVSAYVTPVVVQSAPVVATPVCNACAPQQQCSTSYTQRCYYQPVTTYQQQTYYEPVTTYQTSYYYEPVTSYRYSCYYDPCTCSYQQVATPTTSYQLRAQSCPVQSWVARCVQVPVTSYQKSCYWQPQTTCCQTTVGALIPVNCAAPVNGAAPVVNQPPTITPVPPVNQQPPVLDSQKTPPTIDKSYYPPQQQQQQQQQQPMGMPNASWKPSLGLPIFPTTQTPTPPAPVKLDRLAFGPDNAVDGQVVRSDNTPRPNAKLVFVSSQHPGARQTVFANSAGRFHVNLASGTWHVYVYGADDTPAYHSSFNVQAQQPTTLTLVNR